MGYDVSTVKTSSGRTIDVVRMRGMIENGEWAGWMQATSRLDPSRDTLFILDSPGGAVPGGFFLLNKIEEYLEARKAAGRQAWAMIEKSCSSMCVPVYFEFDKRLAQPDAFLGLHSVSIGGIADDPEQTGLYLGRLTKSAERRGDQRFPAWLKDARARGLFATHDLSKVPAKELVAQDSELVSPDGLVTGVSDAVEKLDAARR